MQLGNLLTILLLVVVATDLVAVQASSPWDTDRMDNYVNDDDDDFGSGSNHEEVEEFFPIPLTTIEPTIEKGTRAEEAESTTIATAVAEPEPEPEPNRPRKSQKSQFQAILDENNDTIQSTQLSLARQKTKLSLSFLNAVIPHLVTIQRNLSDLLTSSSTDPSLTSFKMADEALETELSAVESQMTKNRRLLQQYAGAYKDVERQLTVLHKTLEGILGAKRGQRASFLDTFESTTKATEVTTMAPRNLSAKSSTIASEILSLSVAKAEAKPKILSASIAKVTGTPTIVRDCGSAFKSSEGSIIYKLDEALDVYESCLWTIASNDKNLLNVTLSLKEAGFTQGPHTYLSFLSIRESVYSPAGPHVWQDTISLASSPKSYEISGRVAFIQLVVSPPAAAATRNRLISAANTSSSVGAKGTGKKTGNTGFHLDFKIANMNSTLSEGKYNVFLTGPSGTYKYQQNGQKFMGFKSETLIVLKPSLPNSTLYIKWLDVHDKNNTTSSKSKRKPLPSLTDFLSVLAFESKNFTWQRRDKLDGKLNMEKTKAYARKYPFSSPRNDPVILYFRSDWRYKHSGFEIYWNNTINNNTQN